MQFTGVSTLLENWAPYAAWANKDGYNPHVFDPGVYTLTGTPWTGRNATGAEGTPRTVQFSVINTAARIAISADGNRHDRDDICSSAMEVALLAKNGKQRKLVYFGYNDHHWLSDQAWETDMATSVFETANQWGGYDSLVFKDVTTNHSAAVTALAYEINQSTATNPLIVLGLGPMQVIGEAVATSSLIARPYVTLISHSRWNDIHATQSGASEGLVGTAYNYSAIGAMGVKLCQIQNQNTLLKAPYSSFYWLRESADSKLKWLWQRGHVAGKPPFDCSDSGVVYFVLTGDQAADPAKYQSMLAQ